jgi:hypothetical protein
MTKLFAEFEITLPGHCLYAFAESTEAKYVINVGDVEVQIVLSMPKGWFNQRGDANWVGSLHLARVIASREENEFPPLVIADAFGKRDYSIQADYFEARIDVFAQAAREITNRLVRYFRFVLGTPYLYEFPEGDQAFRNPKWTNEAGEIIGKGPVVVVFARVPGFRGDMQVQRFSEETRSELASFLASPKEFPVFDQLIANARSAWFDGNMQRAVLELAIACEIAMRRPYFSSDDKAIENAKVLRLIDSFALTTFGKSYKEECPDEFDKLDYLFRCRNKIAHRGELCFRDDSGAKVIPDRKLLETWFNSVLLLADWLKAL